MNYQPPPFNHGQKFNPQYQTSLLKPNSTSQLRPQTQSNYQSRTRVLSQQETPRRTVIDLPSSRYLNLQKLKFKPSQFKQSHGIMNQPPDYVTSKYTFKNEFDTARMNEEGNCMFGSCCSVIKETKKEVYISPSQIITMGYFNKNKHEGKSLKIQKQMTNHSMNRSFFKERSNVID